MVFDIKQVNHNKMDHLVDSILNMYKTPEPLRIVMPAPSTRRYTNQGVSSMLDKELDSAHSVESETGYVKEYVQKDEEEYIKVI
jgi:hypothetical protein